MTVDDIAVIYNVIGIDNVIDIDIITDVANN